MTSKKDDFEPVIAVPLSFLDKVMTKREMYAMAAMQGLLAYYGNNVGPDTAKVAYRHADRMIAESEK